jgi:hypothetical protein
MDKITEKLGFILRGCFSQQLSLFLSFRRNLGVALCYKSDDEIPYE